MILRWMKYKGKKNGPRVKRRVHSLEAMNERCTDRRCSDWTGAAPCQNRATFWRFLADAFGGKDKSSRRPVCGQHWKTALRPSKKIGPPTRCQRANLP